ncbi:glutamate:GABA antiporter [Gammaproteobacteria bacterium]
MKRIMRVWDIVFINIAAIVGVRWLAMTAAYGASSILLWVIAMLLFFIPLGLVSTELATTWPDQGGIYVWVREAFGKRAGFMASWFYWVNNFFYYPAVLTFITVIVASIVNPELARNKLFVCGCVLGFLWISTFINVHGMKAFVRFSNLAGIFGVLLPLMLLIILGFGSVWFWKIPIATDYSWVNWLPDLGSKSNLGFLAVLLFSMSGIELMPTMADETENPQKTFPRATFISAFFIVGLYIASTVAITFVLSPEKLGAASGVIDALFVLERELHIPFLALLVGGMIVLGSVGSIGVWIVAPIKMLLESCKDGALPKWLMQTNKDDMPTRALLAQAVVVTLIVICTSFLPSINAFFATLVLLAAITLFIPYVFMFLAFIKLRIKYPEKFRPYRVPGCRLIGYLVSGMGLFSVFSALVLLFVLPPNNLQSAHDILFYRIELIVGPIVFAVVGYVMYALFEMRQKKLY